MKTRSSCFVLLLFCWISATAQNLNSGLLACYPFSGNAFDISGNGHNGTVYGPQLTNDRFGNFNSAYSYDGVDDYIDIGAFISFTTSASFSISVWIKPDTVKLQTILMLMPDDFNDRFNAMAYYDHNGSSSTIWDYGDCTSSGRLMQMGTTFSSAWQHYVYTIDPNSGMYVYKNGVPDIQQSTTSSLVNRNRSLWIGSGWDASNAQFRFRGKIDDIRLYDRELNPAEVQQLFILESLCSHTTSDLFATHSSPFVISVQHGEIQLQSFSFGEFDLFDSIGKRLCKTEKLQPGIPTTINTDAIRPQLIVYNFRQDGKYFSGKIFLGD